ncbi:MAG: F0F1 ATP synthase subunit delta [Candidatus Omnitrophica bacterium]|nr:F0F1 ATP synthase subunit delta [Candidatus Omnitrophota bacterium]
MEFLGLGIVLIGVVVAAIFLTRGLFARDLTHALERVRQQERVLQEKADVLEQRLAQMERDYQAKLKRAETEAERILQEAKSQAMNIRTAAIEEAKHRARQLLLEAEQGKAQLKSAVTRELNGTMARQASESLKTLLTAEQLARVHDALIKELLEALKDVDLRSLPQQAERVELAAAQPLGSAEALRFTQWAAASVGSDVPIHTATEPGLIAGAVVRVGQTVVDNSLVNRLSRGS